MHMPLEQPPVLCQDDAPRWKGKGKGKGKRTHTKILACMNDAYIHFFSSKCPEVYNIVQPRRQTVSIPLLQER